jgi:serine/threonine protein kinase/Tfp pilus assembly protein PilF
MTLPTGTRLGPYEIVAPLGAGGMGEVYLAEDSRLHRKVALKILPSDMAANEDRMRRFQQEATAAAALNHPNIAHIYEIGESDGTNFIAMEFVEGVTLREKIHRERTELRKLLRYLQHVAEGLAKAHAAGIVHRDLKPDNIMITHDGHAKILDFGLAKLIEPQQAPGIDSGGASEDATAIMKQQSTPGMIMGTVGYMSPEQAQGKTNEIDQRSDIFSFGCILFEAVTGHSAFAGKDVIDSLNKIIREPVTPISDFRPDAPDHLQRIVRRCLAKDPEDRYQTIKDVAIELRDLRRELVDDGRLDATVTQATVSNATGEPGTRDMASQTASDSSGSQPSLSSRASSAEYIVSRFKQHKLVLVIAILVLIVGAVGLSLYLRGGTTQAAIESIAVMPFVNERSNADVEYLADGMTETLIGSLSQLPNLSVKARSTVFRYKGKTTDAKTIGKELNVQAILNGRVVQRGDQLTLSLELVDVATENAIWSQQYNRKQTDLVTLQGEIARDVSNKLKSKLSGADVAKVEKNYTTNPEAYQLYLKGRFQWNRRTGESLKQAVEFYKQAIEKDPNYALAYSGLAETYVLFSSYDVAPAADSMPQAKAAALRALEIDDSLAEAHTALGFYLSNYEWDRDASEREYRRAIELKPNYATAHHWFAADLSYVKRFDDSLVELRRAEELDPLSPIIGTNLGDTLVYARRYDEAIAQYKRTLIRDPNFAYAHRTLGWVHGLNGRYPEALAETRTSIELNNASSAKGFLGLWLAKSGKRDYAVKLLGELKQEAARGYVQSYAFALIYIGLGDREEALNWLEKQVSARSETANTYAVAPELDDLRSEPRFKEMLKRMGLPE